MSDEGEGGFNYLASAFWGFIIIGLLIFFWPSLIPFKYFEFWTIKGSVWKAAEGAWPIYLFGLAFNLLNCLRNKDYPAKPHEILLMGFGLSLWAGVMEELCFRWIIFLSAIVMIPFLDWLLLGFMGIHIVHWVYNILLPIADFFTLGYLHPYLANGYGWAVGAAVISSNGKFRDGHGYQGLIGLTVSWFMGMYFFWMMFTYGLIAAMVVHFLYDLLIFLLVAIDASLKKRRWA
jgi:hypothetical protein